MRLWQSVWDVSGRLLVWAEDGTLSGGEAASSDEGYLRRHPRCLSSEELTLALEELDITAGEPVTIKLQLPSRAEAPLRSPRLPSLSEPAAVEWLDEPAQLRVWSVDALALTPLDAVQFLISTPDEGVALRFDDSANFWREVVKLSLELLTRGRFLPLCVREASGYSSTWQPLPESELDHHRLRVLASSMPPVCLAVVRDDVAPNESDPKRLLESFIHHSADALIRLFLRRHPLVPQEPRRAIQPRTAGPMVWLRSLTAERGEIEGFEGDLRKLEVQLRTWSGRVLSQAESHEVRTAFRIVAPEIAEDEGATARTQPWRVEFFVHSAHDPRHQLSAESIWRGEMGFLENSDYSPEELELQLLRDLGRASVVFEELDRALQELHPVAIELSLEEAYAFLRETSKRLEQLGFALFLPTWWAQPQQKLGLKLSVDSGDIAGRAQKGFGFLASQELLEFSWEVALGDRMLSLEQFQELALERAPLVFIDNQWVELQPKKIEATLQFLERQGKQKKMRFVDVVRLGLGVQTDALAIPVVGFTARGWIQQLLSADSHALPLLQEPEGFLGELRPYQREGISWLSFLSSLGIGGCLADDMGLGKTVQLLALLLHERHNAAPHGERVNPTLLVVPMSIIANWEQEARRFAPSLNVYLHHGAQRLTGEAFIAQAQSVDVVITTYSLVFRDEPHIAAVTWGRIALDEAQNIKNLETKQTKSVRRVVQRQLQRGDDEAPCQRIALTGTPLENHLEELWSIFDFLNPGFLGSVQDFRTRFAVPIERYRDKEASATLSRLLQPFVLRRLKSDPRILSDLPEKIEMDVLISLTPEQASLYQGALDEMLPQVDQASGMHRKGLVLATITRLKQICNHPALFLKDTRPLEGRSMKVQRLEQLLEIVLAEGDKSLIFTQFAQMGHLLKPYLQERFGVEVLFLHGSLPKRAREAMVAKFQTPAGPPIFILSLKAGGFGLNLTEATQVIHLDQWWNPAVEDQATDRAYRIGQKRNVQVRKLLCQGTLEERISELLKRKKELASEVVGSTKSALTQLSTDELRGLLELSHAAIGG